MKKISIFLVIFLFLCSLNINVYANNEPSLTQEQLQIMNTFTTTRIKEFKKTENEIKNKKREIEVIKNTKISTRFQEEKISKLNKEIKVLEKDIKKQKKAYKRDYVKTYNSMLTKEQKSLRIKKNFFNIPRTMPLLKKNYH